MTLVTVVLPCLAFDDYARLAVRSLGENAVADDLEVIAVIDGEGGGEPERIRVGDVAVRVVVTGQRRGSAHATNVGIALAQGAYVGRMDADDVSLPGRLDAELSVLDGDPRVVAVGGGGRLLSPEGVVVGEYPPVQLGDLRSALLRRNPVIHSSLIVRRRALAEVGGYDERMIRMQDYDLLLRLAQIGVVWGMGDRELVDYRVHPHQTSTRAARFGTTMRRITRERTRLAGHIGHSVSAQRVHNGVYVAGQAARYGGLRRPRYLRGLDETTPQGAR